MQQAKAAIVTTIDEEGKPHTRSMFNLRNEEKWPKLVPMFQKHEEDFMMLFTTNTSSSKVKHLRKNRTVSVFFVLPDEWQSVMFGGEMVTVEEDDVKKSIWHDGWEKYYPTGYNDPDHTVLRLLPDFAEGWNQSTKFSFELR
jgi:general stress protein 26